jgi:SnoaL-like polyketide cyclase
LTRHDRHACCAAYRALPGLHAAEHHIVAAGKTLTVRYIVVATHQGNLLGLTRTGRRVHWGAAGACHLPGPMIAEEWAAGTVAAVLHQVGAYPPPWLAIEINRRNRSREHMKIGLVGKGNVVRPTPNVIQCSRDDSGQARVGHPPNAGICRHPVHGRPVNASLLGTAPRGTVGRLGMVRRQAPGTAGVASLTAELTDTDPAAIRWAAARMRAEWAARRHTTPVADMTGTEFCGAAGLTRRPPARIRCLRARRNRPAKPRPLPTVTTAWAQSMLIT